MTYKTKSSKLNLPIDGSKKNKIQKRKDKKMFTSKQQEQIAESVDNIIANSRRDFSSYITFQVTCSSVELFAKVNGVEYTRSINFSTRDGETYQYSITTAEGLSYDWGTSCDVYDVVNMIGFDQEIIDGFEADVLGL